MSGKLGRLLTACAVGATVLVTAALGSAAPGASRRHGRGSGGGSGVLVAFGGSPGKPLAQYEVSIAVKGEASVSFHGDQASGCRRHGLCGYKGEIVLRPDPSGVIFVSKYRRHHRISESATLFLDLGSTGMGLAAHTTRFANGSEAGLCADGAQSAIFPTAQSTDGRLTLALVQSGDGILSTRCAGPLDGDVAQAAPRATVPVRSLMRPGRLIDLSGTHRFAGHGFAGTVTSTIVLRVRSSRRGSGGSGPIKGKTKRIRFVTEKLQLVGLSGGLTASLRGTPNTEVCRLLDSCGLSGTLSWSPMPVQANGELTATGLASRPMRDFRAALGLGGPGNPRRISVNGSIEWKDLGSVIERVTQSGQCVDSASLGRGSVLLIVRRKEIATAYYPGSPLRTRCPGPLLQTDVARLAVGAIHPSSFARRRFTINLVAATRLQEDGYLARLSGHLALVVKRSRRTAQHVVTEPASLVGLFSR